MYLYPEGEQGTTSALHDYSLDPYRHTDFGINLKMQGFVPGEEYQNLSVGYIESLWNLLFITTLQSQSQITAQYEHGCS